MQIGRIIKGARKRGGPDNTGEETEESRRKNERSNLTKKVTGARSTRVHDS